MSAGYIYVNKTLLSYLGVRVLPFKFLISQIAEEEKQEPRRML